MAVKSPKPKKKFDPRNLLVLLFSVVLTLGIAEVALRIIFSSDQTLFVQEFQDRKFLINNEFFKIWHWPNNTVNHTKDCFSVTYHTNKFGMRDSEVKLAKSAGSTRFAFLGDSFTEGYAVQDHECFAARLDSMWGSEVEVLNFGMSGGYGTVHQAALHERFVTHFQPDVVVVFFLNYNDLYDNVAAIEEGYVNESLALTFEAGDSSAVFNAVCNREVPEKLNPVVSNLYVVQLIQRGIRGISGMWQSAANTRMDFNSPLADVYSRTPTSGTERGWILTEAALKRLQQNTERDGSKLVVVQLADPYQIDANWLAHFADEGMELDPNEPVRQLKAICDRLGIPHHDMYSAAMEHVAAQQLEFPLLSYTCDRHMNPQGHAWAAKHLQPILEQYVTAN